MTHRSLDAPDEKEESEAAVMARCVREGRFTYLFCVGWDLWSQRPLLRPSHAPGIKRVFPDVRCCRLFAKKKMVISAAAAPALSAASSEWIKHQSFGSPALLHSVIFTEAARQRSCDF